MKRSRKISLVLLGGATVGAITACAPVVGEPRISPESVYPNDYYVRGAGYYHAPFQAFYAERYNHFDAARKGYYYGGAWHPVPHQSVVNVSAPTLMAAQAAEAARAAVERAGFGHTGRSHGVWS